MYLQTSKAAFSRWFYNVNIYSDILKLILVTSNSGLWWSNEIDNFILLQASPFQRRVENKVYTAFDFLATRKLSWLASTNNNSAIYLIEIETGFWRDLYSYSTPRLLAGSPVARRVRVDDGSM